MHCLLLFNIVFSLVCKGSPANSRGLTQNFSMLLSAILSIKRGFLLHFLKKVHKNVGSRTCH